MLMPINPESEFEKPNKHMPHCVTSENMVSSACGYTESACEVIGNEFEESTPGGGVVKSLSRS